MSDALRSILRRLGLEQLVGTLEDEELYSVPMLQSMGPMFEANMRELGLSDERAIGRLKTALSM